jgi:transcriptional regulator with XRE-family HTH domain
MILNKISPIDLYISKKLRQFRISQGMTQEKLGELTGVSIQQIQKYEAAKNRISASRLFEFSQFLNKPINSFFDGIKSDKSYYNYEFKSQKESYLDLIEFNREILPLISAFNSVNDLEVKKYFVSLLSSVAKMTKQKKIKHGYS